MTGRHQQHQHGRMASTERPAYRTRVPQQGGRVVGQTQAAEYGHVPHCMHCIHSACFHCDTARQIVPHPLALPPSEVWEAGACAHVGLSQEKEVANSPRRKQTLHAARNRGPGRRGATRKKEPGTQTDHSRTIQADGMHARGCAALRVAASLGTKVPSSLHRESMRCIQGSSSDCILVVANMHFAPVTPVRPRFRLPTVCAHRPTCTP